MKTLKKLTKDNIVLDKFQCNKIRAMGTFCSWQCDSFCGDKVGNDGTHYSCQRSFWEGPLE